jgi:hypothetical protein
LNGNKNQPHFFKHLRWQYLSRYKRVLIGIKQNLTNNKVMLWTILFKYRNKLDYKFYEIPEEKLLIFNLKIDKPKLFELQIVLKDILCNLIISYSNQTENSLEYYNSYDLIESQICLNFKSQKIGCILAKPSLHEIYPKKLRNSLDTLCDTIKKDVFYNVNYYKNYYKNVEKYEDLFEFLEEISIQFLYYY